MSNPSKEALEAAREWLNYEDYNHPSDKDELLALAGAFDAFAASRAEKPVVVTSPAESPACQRCGGGGENWSHDGVCWVCPDCNGTGRSRKKKS